MSDTLKFRVVILAKRVDSTVFRYTQVIEAVSETMAVALTTQRFCRDCNHTIGIKDCFLVEELKVSTTKHQVAENG